MHPFLLLLPILLPTSSSAIPLNISFSTTTSSPPSLPYNPSFLSPRRCNFIHIPSAPPSYSTHLRCKFSYSLPLPPGLYNLTFGLIEKRPCKHAKRLFQISANGRLTNVIDVHAAVGCKMPYQVRLPNVPVENVLVIKGIKVKKAPTLANFVVEPAEHLPPPSPTPSTTSTSSPSASPSLSPPAQSAPHVKIVFTKFQPPPGWHSFNPSYLTPGTELAQFGSSTQHNAYTSHAKSPAGFSYLLPLPPGLYNVRLGFLEVAACQVAKRVFRLSVNGNNREAVDVFRSAGCDIPYDICFDDVQVLDVLQIAVQPVSGFAPFLANFEVSQMGSMCKKERFDVEVNAGAVGEVLAEGLQGTRSTFASVPIDTALVEGPNQYYKSGRFGGSFVYSFDAQPGEYEVVLGLVEFYMPFCQAPGSRVFHVYVNGVVRLEGYDIFDQQGCYTAKEHVLSASVSSIGAPKLDIKFVAVANYAQVSYLRVRAVQDVCTPVRGEIVGDHAAHSVPGIYPPRLKADSPTSYVDRVGKGYVNVQIDGSSSHTHFQDSETGTPGKVTDYVWTLVETGQVISRTPTFSYDFPLGTTRLRLWVRDNACTQDEAETSVSVTGKIQPGAYCYYYTALAAFPTGHVATDPRPMFAHVAGALQFGFPSFEFDSTLFTARCFFFLQVNEPGEKEVHVDTMSTGLARVKRGDDILWDSTGSGPTPTEMAVGLVAFEVIYRRTSATQTPTFKFLVDGDVPDPQFISHDQSTVVPILKAVDPKEGKPEGGAKVKISGYGLYQPLTISFGGKLVDVVGGNEEQVFVNSPPASGDVVEIYAESEAGIQSNAVGFSYGGSCDAVAFEKAEIMNGDSKVDYLNLPTCVTLGHDGKLYMGGLSGKVDVLGYDMDTLKVTSYCYSEEVKDAFFLKGESEAKRVLLGIAIDPRDLEIRPYVSSNTLYWWEHTNINRDNIWAWANGAVDRLKPGSNSDPGVCLVYDKRIVSFIPVSNHDHGVNSLVFTQDGDLLIAVGGFTNMGLPGWKLGGTWETEFSAAVLKAKVSKADFDGTIAHSSSVLYEAKPVGGDVELYATGLRNVFGMGMSRDGKVYAADQGPNCSFGDSATNCDEFDAERAGDWDLDEKVDWTGITKNGWIACPYGPGRPDKVLHIVQGGFYGHANLQRAECSWIDPYSHKTADGKAAPESYREQLALLKSPVTGVGEYGAKHWCSALRGEVLLSTYNNGKLYRMEVDGDEVLNGPDEVFGESGIAFVENARGDLVFPRLSEKEVFVLRPKISKQVGVYIAGVTPWRHGRDGGSLLTIGGDNFGSMPKVWVGGVECVIDEALGSSMTKIVCRVPEYGGGDTLVDVAVMAEGEIDSVGGAVLYMDV